MINTAKRIVKKILGMELSPKEVFLSYRLQQITQRRLEHLASLGLNIARSTVLEVGTGIGDHTSFFLDRGCQVVSTEARKENLEILRSRYPSIEARYLNLDHPDTTLNESFDIVYCYGVLYHLEKPAEAIKFMSEHCRKMLLLETCVSFGDGELLNPSWESPENPVHSISGHCCSPTRKWVYHQLREHFNSVYIPITQPNHEEFPTDWNSPPRTKSLSRSIFIASRQILTNPLLIEDIPMRQSRH